MPAASPSGIHASAFGPAIRDAARILITVLLLGLPSPRFAQAEVRRVANGGDLQAALNAARAGDEIRLAPGATFKGNFVLPAFDGTAPVTVRTDLPDQALPDARTRMTPASAARFARIVSETSSPALRTAPGAHHWTLRFLEFPANKGGYGDIIAIGDGSSKQASLAGVPHDIVLDHLYVHGDPDAGQKRGIALNGAAVAITNCHISDIKGVGVDAQAIAGWNGPGPFTIENNYLEAAGEVVLFGGADPAIKDLVPSDITVRFNHITRPMSWRGSRWQVKNLFELKNARRVRVEWNLLENNWRGAQPGYAVLFTPRNQDGHCPWCVIEDVVFAHNVVRNVAAVLNVLGEDSPNPSGRTRDVRITDNLFSAEGKRLGGNGWGVLIGSGPRDVVIDHNTFDLDGTTVVYAWGSPKAAGFQFTNNAARHGTYGINGAGSSTGTPALNAFFDAPQVTGNWLSGGPGSKYPTGNRFDGTFDADDAQPAGADVAALRAAAEAIARGVPPNVTSSAK
jgi:hypothetical protein